jgi:hypothetical protein
VPGTDHLIAFSSAAWVASSPPMQRRNHASAETQNEK